MKRINQLQMVAYIIVTSREITDFKDKEINNYLNILEKNLEAIDEVQILNRVDLRLFNDFRFRQSLNITEVKNYTKLILNRLFNYYNKEFNEKDIIKEAEHIFYSFSIRTSEEEILKLKNI